MDDDSAAPDQKLKPEEFVALVTSVAEIAKLLPEVDRQSAKDKHKKKMASIFTPNR